jgi:hypothetical protein
MELNSQFHPSRLCLLHKEDAVRKAITIDCVWLTFADQNSAAQCTGVITRLIASPTVIPPPPIFVEGNIRYGCLLHNAPSLTLLYFVVQFRLSIKFLQLFCTGLTTGLSENLKILSRGKIVFDFCSPAVDLHKQVRVIFRSVVSLPGHHSDRMNAFALSNTGVVGSNPI